MRATPAVCCKFTAECYAASIKSLEFIKSFADLLNEAKCETINLNRYLFMIIRLDVHTRRVRISICRHGRCRDDVICVKCEAKVFRGLTAFVSQ